MYKKININDDVEVHLRPRGLAIYQEYYKLHGIPSLKGKRGWYTFQLHFLMEIFGPYLVRGEPAFLDMRVKID